MKATRRQLLRGSLAAPLVLTARSASAWALTSAAACRFKDAREAEHEDVEKLCYRADDEWLRCDIDMCKLTVTKPHYDQKYCKQGEELDGDHFLGADKTTYWRVYDDRGRLSAEKTKHTVYNCSYAKTGKKKYGLCYVDDDCQQVGYCWEDYGGKCITKSCWWSIKGSKWG
jgi:hypothetical protein